MRVDLRLIQIRSEFDAGNIDEQEFTDRTNQFLAEPLTNSDGERAAALSKIVLMISEAYKIGDIDNGIQYLKSDLNDYVFETVMEAIYGPKFFNFYNKTYESA